MFRIAVKSVLAYKVRLALTALAIVLGVSLVTGTFIFTDTINRQFDTLFDEIFEGIDVTVRAGQADFSGSDVPFDASIIDVVAAVDGVEVVAGGVGSLTSQVLDKNQEAIGGQGPPTLGFSWSGVASLSPLQIRQGNGRAPQGPGEVAIDVNTAKVGEFETGDTITVVNFDGPGTFELVGLVSFGDQDTLLGATLSVFELGEARRLFGYGEEFTAINVKAAAGLSSEDLQARIAAVLPEGLEAVTGQTQVNEQAEEIGTALGFINIGLLSFAGVAIFVGAFIIQNTFRIIIAQRTRELALLRAVGATGAQVVRLVVVEALITALIASAAGIVFGFGMAVVIRGLMNLVGLALPPGDLVLVPRTILIGLAVGLGLTLASAVLPARKAARVPPVAAIREEAARPKRRTLRRRAAAGTGLTAVGAVALAVGLIGTVDNGIAFVGAGAAIIFIGVSVLAPLAARPLADIIGWPLPRIAGVGGQLARENTKRQPRRTASTASALMVGVALVVFFTIFAASTKASVEQTIFELFPADLTFQSSNQGDPQIPAPFSPRFVTELEALDAIGVVSAQTFDFAVVEGSQTAVSGLDPDTVGEVLALKPVGDALDNLREPDTVVVSESELESRGWVIGDSLEFLFGSGDTAELTIVGVLETDDLGNFYLSTDTFAAHFTVQGIGFALANVAEGHTLADAKLAADELAAEFGNIKVQSKSDLVADAEDQINQALGLFTGLLLFAVLIAVLGITNTLTLSIYERTREIGLLRAVGMARRQVRRMVRWEAVIIAVFGAILGVMLGIFFGWAVLTALRDEGFGAFAIPFGQVGLSLILAGVAGVIAAAWPAWKAARLNILEAIGYE